MVTELKGITEAVNSPVEDEFEVFGKHIGLQLQSMPLLLALEAQEHIQVYLNRLRRQHLQNSSDQNIIITRSSTPSVSSYTQQKIHLIVLLQHLVILIVSPVKIQNARLNQFLKHNNIIFNIQRWKIYLPQ